MQAQYAPTGDHIESLSDPLTRIPERISDCITQPGRVGDQLALVDSGGSWTYGQLADATDCIESWVIYLGIRAGDRVMIVSENCRAFVATLFALSRVDACPVLVNAKLSPREVDQLQAMCAARRIFYMINASWDAKTHATRHGASVVDAVDWGPVAVGPLNQHARPEAINREISNRVAAEICSCDSAGNPRSEKLTHRNLLLVAAACTRLSGLTSGNPLYGALPMCEGLGLSAVLLPLLLTGGTVRLTQHSDLLPALKDSNGHP